MFGSCGYYVYFLHFKMLTPGEIMEVVTYIYTKEKFAFLGNIHDREREKEAIFMRAFLLQTLRARVCPSRSETAIKCTDVSLH